MRDPRPPPPKEPEPEWSDTPSDVIHLTDSTFDPFIQVCSQKACVFKGLFISSTSNLFFILAESAICVGDVLCTMVWALQADEATVC